MEFFKQYGWIVIAIVAFFLIVILVMSIRKNKNTVKPTKSIQELNAGASDKKEEKVELKEEPKKEVPLVEEKKPEVKATAKKSSAKTTEKKTNSKKTNLIDSSVKVVEKKSTPSNYRVIYDKVERVWQVKKDGAKRVVKNFATKVEALEHAKELSEKNDMGLTVHKKDGKFQKKN